MSESWPEGWKQVVTRDWNDPSWGNGGGEYVWSISLCRWKPARRSRFLKRIIVGRWEIFSTTAFGNNAPTDEQKRLISDSNRETIQLVERDEIRLNVSSVLD